MEIIYKDECSDLKCILDECATLDEIMPIFYKMLMTAGYALETIIKCSNKSLEEIFKFVDTK